jgi:membrane protein YqaA with SNARE-associated domain
LRSARSRIELNGYWRAFVAGLCACAALGVAIMIFAPDLVGIFLCALYAIPSNSVFPIPHEPGLLFFAKYYDPLWIAAAATFGSIVMSFADYAMVETMLRRSRLARQTRDSRLMQWGVRWMKRWPFGVVVVFSLVPLPITVIRVLAPLSGYPIGRYIAAQIVGRFPRFLILAMIGHAIQVPTWILAALTLLLIVALWAAGRDTGAGDAELEDPDGAEDPAPVTAR